LRPGLTAEFEPPEVRRKAVFSLATGAAGRRNSLKYEQKQGIRDGGRTQWRGTAIA